MESLKAMELELKKSHSKEWESLKAESKEKFKKEVTNLKMKLFLMDALSLPESAFPAGFIHSYKSDCHIQLSAPTLNDAMVIAERMNPIAMVRYKPSCLSFIPLIYSENEEYETLITPYIYELKAWTFTSTIDKTLTFYIKAGSYIVDVRVKIESDPLTNIEYGFRGSHSRYQEREFFCTLVNKSGLFPQSDRFYASHNEPNNFTLWSH